MEILHAKCAGLDVHKDTVVACVRLVRGREFEQHIEEFGTRTPDLLRLLDWLRGYGVTHVAMEATGVYWRPVWHILEGEFDLTLANPHEVKNVPGRKTDVKDAAWLSDLLAHGLIRSSFVAPQPIAELRDLTRTRKQLVGERSPHVQRIQKILEDANLKLASVVSDIMGMSGRAILEAIVQGVSAPDHLAKLADGRLKASRKDLIEALTGRIREHHRFMLRLHLDQINALDHAIAALERRVQGVLAPFAELVERLQTIPGIKDVAAAVLLAEIGMDMSTFPTAAHLISWACLCPSNDESAGKRRSTRTRKSVWLKATLVQAAWAAVRQRDTYLHAQFHRIRSRRGGKKAILAVAASMLTAAYYIIKNGVTYNDHGADYFQRRDKTKVANRLVQRLANLGYSVEIKPLAA